MTLKTVSPTPCLFFYSVIYFDDQFDLASINKILDLDINHTEFFYPLENPSLDYYAKEMGQRERLKRLIILDTRLAQREDLVPKKLNAINLEKQFSDPTTLARKINIDPGFIALEQMVLSTTKPYAHRILLSQNIYADLNYIFEKGAYHVLPWTYPDYIHDEKRVFFSNARKKYL